LKKFFKVPDVLNLTRLRDSITFRGEPSLSIKFHHFICFLKNAQVQKEATNDGPSSSLAVIAVKNSDSLRISNQKFCNLLADDEKNVERRRLVVLPLEADYILQFSFLNAAAADIHGDIFILVRVLQKLPDGVYRVPVQFLDA
jgi:hypothetical protein